ncbi:MAG: hypothetical protein ACYCU7_06905 [Acidimicrobiales bacterium]
MAQTPGQRGGAGRTSPASSEAAGPPGQARVIPLPVPGTAARRRARLVGRVVSGLRRAAAESPPFRPPPADGQRAHPSWYLRFPDDVA